MATTVSISKFALWDSCSSVASAMDSGHVTTEEDGAAMIFTPSLHSASTGLVLMHTTRSGIFSSTTGSVKPCACMFSGYSMVTAPSALATPISPSIMAAARIRDSSFFIVDSPFRY